MAYETNYDITNFYKKVRKNKLEGFAITSSNASKVYNKEVMTIGDGTVTVYTTDTHGYPVPGSVENFDNIKDATEELLNRLMSRKAVIKDITEDSEKILEVY